MRKENHHSKLDRSINPDEPALHWTPEFKTKMLGHIDQQTNLAEKSNTDINQNSFNSTKGYVR